MNTMGYHFLDCVLLQKKKEGFGFEEKKEENVIKVSSQLTVS